MRPYATVAADGAEVTTSGRATLEERFDQLIADNHAALRRLAASYAATPSDRDDLLQEIAIALWRALPAFRGDCSERTFLFRIAHNRCITYLSRKRATVSIDDTAIEPADPAASSEAQANGAACELRARHFIVCSQRAGHGILSWHFARRFGALGERSVKPFVERGLLDEDEFLRGQAHAAADDLSQGFD